MLLNVLKGTGPPPTTKNYLASNVNGAAVEKLCKEAKAFGQI